MAQPIAYPARDVARVITRNRKLMQEYSSACQDGRVQAVSAPGGNLVVVLDAALSQRLQAAGPKLEGQLYEGPLPGNRPG